MPYHEIRNSTGRTIQFLKFVNSHNGISVNSTPIEDGNTVNWLPGFDTLLIIRRLTDAPEPIEPIAPGAANEIYQHEGEGVLTILKKR